MGVIEQLGTPPVDRASISSEDAGAGWRLPDWLAAVPVEKITIWTACGLLVVLSLSIFLRAVHFLPADAVDLRLFSVAIHTHNPLKYLVGDWGEAPYETGQFGMYRPLHPISLWIVYKALGLRWLPNQLINVGLHTLNAILVLMLVWRIQRDAVLSFMGASIFLVSVHTMSPAVWVTDRASLQVGLALLLLMHHLVGARQSGRRPRAWYIFLLCLLALLSKESGLVVPFAAIVDSLLSDSPMRKRVWPAAVWAGVIGVYLFGRFLMFGANAASYSKGGYLFGFWRYDRVVDLPEYLRRFCLVDNALKNMLESFLPILNDEGGFRMTSHSEALCTVLGVVAMGCLVLLTAQRKLRVVQIECLWIVLFNALLHNEVFRYRVLYTAQIAVCVFLASSPLLKDARRKALAATAASLLLLASTVRVDNFVQSEYLTRYNEMHQYKLEHVMHSYPGKRIDPALAQQLVEKYGNQQ